MALSSLELEMSMNIARLQADTGKAVKIVENFGRNIKFALAGAFAGLSAVALKEYATGVIGSVAALDDMAERTGAAVESLSKLSAVAGIGGHSMETLEMGLVRLAKALGSVDEKAAPAKEALKSIGIDPAKLGTKDTAEAFTLVAEKLNGYRDGLNKTAILVEIFGRSGAQLAPIIKDMADQHEKLRIITAEEASQAEILEKQWKSFVLVIGEAKKALVIDMIPALIKIVEAMKEAYKESGLLMSVLVALGGVASNLFSRSDAKQLELLNQRIDATKESLERLNDAPGPYEKINDQQKARLATTLLNDINERNAILARQKPIELPKIELPDAPQIKDTRKESAKKSPFQTAVEQLEKEAIKAEDLSRRIEVLREIELGSYGKLNPLQKEKLETLAKIVDKVKEEIAVRKADVDAQKYLQEEIQKLETLADKWRDLADPIRERNRLIAEGEELMRIGKLTPEQFRIGTMDAEIRGILQAKTLQEKLDEAWNAGKITLEEYQRVLESVNKETEKTGTLAHDLGMTFSSAFEDAVAGGKSLRDILSGIEKDLLRLGTRKLVTEPMLKWFEGVMGGGGGFGGILSSIFGSGGSNYAADIVSAGGGVNFPALAVSGYMAHGGAVGGGKSYIVGERGPELFTPSMSGMVTPNSKLGMTVNNVFYLSTPTDKRTQDQISAIAGQSVQRALARNT